MTWNQIQQVDSQTQQAGFRQFTGSVFRLTGESTTDRQVESGKQVIRSAGQVTHSQQEWTECLGSTGNLNNLANKVENWMGF